MAGSEDKNIRKRITTKDMAVISLFTALICVGAYIKIPFFPVAISLQTFFVMLSGLILKPKLAFVPTTLYMAIGLVGLPVFTFGGGVTSVLQPSFGYVIGFCFASYVIAHFISRNKKNMKNTVLSLIIGNGIIYFFGVAYFYLVAKYVLEQPAAFSILIINCFLIFIPGDIVKSILAIAVSKKIKKANVIQ